MKIDPIMIVREYWEEVKDQYPEMDYTEFTEVCYMPWEYTKKHMSSGELPAIRLKYFGLFAVTPKKAKFELATIKDMYKRGTMDKKRYDNIKGIITKFLDNEKLKEQD